MRCKLIRVLTPKFAIPKYIKSIFIHATGPSSKYISSLDPPYLSFSTLEGCRDPTPCGGAHHNGVAPTRRKIEVKDFEVLILIEE